MVVFFFQAEDGIRDGRVTGVQTCALPILGVGVRAVSGEKTAFAYSDEISFDALQDAAKATRAIAAAGQARVVKAGSRKLPIPLYASIDPIASLASTEKVALLERIERKCRARDPRVTQVMASLGGEYEVVLI